MTFSLTASWQHCVECFREPSRENIHNLRLVAVALLEKRVNCLGKILLICQKDCYINTSDELDEIEHLKQRAQELEEAKCDVLDLVKVQYNCLINL